jgi:serine/threonine-protein kinase
MALVLAGAAVAALPAFPADSVWRRDISHAPVAKGSDVMLHTLQSLGGWGNGNRMQIDFSIVVLRADADTPARKVVEGVNGYYEDECDAPGFAFPVPRNGAIEDSPGYSCDPEEGDCHLLVQQGNLLYESYGTNVTDKGVESTCAVVWHLDKTYPPSGRGDHCTSADAAGFPIAPLLIDADEVAAAVDRHGDLGHALRFILPNDRMAAGVYVHPASHAGAPKGPATSIPYGSRLRLRADFPMQGYNAAAQAILRTMQRYGIVLADGGRIALTAADDRFDKAKWSQLGIDSHTFFTTGVPVKVTDFEVIDTGPRIAKEGECRLNRVR